MSELSFELYKRLYKIRRAEEFVIKHYHENDMKTPMHMSMGQEAIPTGVCSALAPDDQIFSSYRSHAAFLAKTDDVGKFFAELYGKQCGTAEGKAGSMHLADPDKGHMYSSAIVASCLPVAVGAAFAHKQQRTGRIAAVFFGDGAVDEGVFWESLNVASVMGLPALFVCEDNGLAVHTATGVRHGFESLSGVARQFRCHVFREDTNDVEAIHATTAEAISAMKTSNQPAFLHFTCYRYLEHVGIDEDFDAGYRSRDDFSAWYQRDAVALQRARVVNNGCTEHRVREAEETIEAEIRASIDLAKAAAFPLPAYLYKGVFHEAS